MFKRVAYSSAILLGLACSILSGCSSNETPTDQDSPTTKNSQANADKKKSPAKEPEKPATTEPIAPAPEPVPLSEEELAAGWIRLFDGSTLFGWQANSDANWQVVDGAIRVDARLLRRDGSERGRGTPRSTYCPRARVGFALHQHGGCAVPSGGWLGAR